MVRGNHYWRFKDGTDGEQLLAQILGVRYLGVEGIVRLDLMAGSKVKDQLVISAHHA